MYACLHFVGTGIFMTWYDGAREQYRDGVALEKVQQFADLLQTALERVPDKVLTERLESKSPYGICFISPEGEFIAANTSTPPDVKLIAAGREFQVSRASGKSYAILPATTSSRKSAVVFTSGKSTPASGVTSGRIMRIETPLDSWSSAPWALRLLPWIFSFAIFGIALVVMQMLASHAARPWAKFFEYAKSVASGKFDRSLPLTDDGPEWQQLGDLLNRMQKELSVRERQLRDYSERLETVFGTMIEGVIVLNAQSEIEFANASARVLFGFPQRELAGKLLFDLIRYPELQRGLESAKREAATVKLELETLNNPRRLLSLRITRLPGTAPGLVMIAQDITELRQLETIRRDFVTNVSHELKTPLASIKAYSETLRMGAAEDSATRLIFLQEIEEQADRLNNIIIDLIQLARIEGGQALFEIEDVAIEDGVLTSINTFKNVAASKDLELVAELQPGIIVRADAEGLETIIDNLLSNAIRYTPNGGTVRIRSREDGEFGLIEVEDTGVGISVEHLSRIFERFYRVDRARSREVGGTGLGLSIVKHLCQQFEGDVQVDSKVGRGSRFTVTIPLTKPKNDGRQSAGQ